MSLYSVVVLYIILNIHWENYIPVWRKYSFSFLKEDFELILVDDGSKDRSYEIMTELRERITGYESYRWPVTSDSIKLALCGFAHVKGEFVVTMDDDLQHQPEELPKMVRTMQERPDVDVIITSYEGRKHDCDTQTGNEIFCMGNFKDAGKRSGSSDHQLKLIRRFLVDAMVKTNAYLPQIGNLLIGSSNRIINVPVQHADRAYGKSGYSFKRLLKDLIYDITTHTAFPFCW